MLRPFSYSSPYLGAFLLLFSSTLTLADDPPQQSSSSSDVTWLYPSLSVPSLTFNTLDTINVSWISHNAPAYLKLSCQTNNYYTTALELPVPATGNRLISLLSLLPSTSTSTSNPTSPPPYQSCTFQLSSPTNITNISQSVAFNLTSLPITTSTPPAFWSLDPTSFSAATQTFLDQKSRADDARRCGEKNTSTSAMAAIGVGVAVGVFALTTAGFVLYEVQRRRKVQLAERETESESVEEEGEGGSGGRRRGATGKKWMAKSLKGGGGGGGGVGATHTKQQEGDEKPSRPRPCGTMNDFSHIARSEIHPAERDQQMPVELESPSGGRYA